VPVSATATAPTPTVTLVSTYPPTVCGLATFTSNLAAAIAGPAADWRTAIVRVLDRAEDEVHEEVVAQWIAGDHASLVRAVAAIESSDVVVLQHEYGLFGGLDGEDVLELIRAIRVPLIVVLHTVLANPTEHQRSVLDGVITPASAVVTQSESARGRLIASHGTDPDKVVVIPHGAAANFAGPVDRDVKRPAVLTWGLLGPGKGIEYGIAAVSLLQGHSPAPTYIVAGQTHPKVLATQGERYRNQLRDLGLALELGRYLQFDDSYREWDSLRALVRSVDVVLLPYDSLDQVCSGVLVEALASAKPVVATRFPLAQELLSNGAGLVVPQGDVAAMAAALERILYEPGLAAQLSEAARRRASVLLWPSVGAAYRELIAVTLTARLSAPASSGRPPSSKSR
jgi:glycosyltransferase involved in cell wall biosynthesis